MLSPAKPHLYKDLARQFSCSPGDRSLSIPTHVGLPYSRPVGTSVPNGWDPSSRRLGNPFPTGWDSGLLQAVLTVRCTQDAATERRRPSSFRSPDA